MAKKQVGKYESQLDWYYVSKASMWKWLLVFVVLAVGIVGGIYAMGRRDDPVKRAESEIATAEQLIVKAQLSPQAPQLKNEIDAASRKVADAHALLDDAHPVEALASAREASSLARRVSADSTHSDASILETEGKVEVQHANRASWEAAKNGQKLFDGDFLKTGATGTVDVMSSDGTLYRIKHETLFEVHRTNVSIGPGGVSSPRSEVKLVVGVIDTSTGENGRSIIKTDAGTADIGARSNVAVDVDSSKNTSVSNFRGTTTLSTQSGEKVVLSDHERVTALRSGAPMAAKIKLPDAPAPMRPDNNVVFDLAKKAPVSIKWTKVADAAHYHLQIARVRLFVPDSLVVDLLDRKAPEAVIGVNEEGSFYWRVAALSKTNQSSEWSETRRFKVLGANAVAGPDSIPPDLVLQRPQVIGSLVIITGKTEPGATVTVNGEGADTDISGNFKKTISINQEGLSTIVVKATDGAGNETLRKENALIQN
ncbi:MAG: hypothetical protein ABIT01_01885 [Thermoanaerobaculia bacterium]